MRKRTYILIAILIAIFFGRFIIDAVRFSPVFFQLAFNSTVDLKKADHTVNVLLLGIGGGSHEGPDLTDTIMFLSVNTEKNKATLLSIPRDLWILELDGKINTAYAVGQSKKKGGGLVLAKAVVKKIIKEPVDYAVALDFDGFVKAVDLIGGLDIDIERAFDDYEYPDEEKREDLCGHSLEEATALVATQEATLVFPCRYIHVHFDKGGEHMDGKRALIYVRSRYAKDEEGTDFARSRRQQKVIQTFKDKVFSLGTLLNPIKLSNLYSVISDSVDTDINTSEFDDFIRLAQKMRGAKISSVVIEEEDKEQNKPGLLTNPPAANFNGLWVLIPRAGNGNYSEIQEYVQCILTKDTCSFH